MPVLMFLAIHGSAQPRMGPLQVCEDNPRYFADGSGKPVLLVGSHMWNSLQDMGQTDPPEPLDWEAYLDFLEARNHNFVRLWHWDLTHWDTASNREKEPRRLFVDPHPWLRAGPGNAIDGRPKFDLTKFDEEYFTRLRDRLISAGERGIYMSVMLFEGWGLQFVEDGWDGHPFNPANNINEVDGNGLAVHELGDAIVTAIQETYVRKVVDTVNDLDNVLYEISNENHPASTEWQYHMIDYIRSCESTRPKQHPVGMTFQYKGGSNQTLFDSPADWISPDPDGGYSTDPPAADGSKVIITDTDHLWGIGGNQAWVWKSFCRGLNPIFMDPYDGVVLRDPFDPQYDPIRKNIGYCLRISERVDLAKCVPSDGLSSTGYCLASPGSEYVVYAPEGGAFTVDLEGAEGLLSVEWLDPTVGRTAFGARVVGGKTVEFVTPFDGDAVLLLQRVTQDADEKDPARLGIVPPEPIADDFVLRVSEDGHRLVNGDGQPFFWLGDTGWAMLTALTLDETETYLENRRQKGFNVVQCIAAHWNPGAVEPNQASDGPWTDDDPSKPNAAFFDHVDRVCEMAQAKGIVIGLLPCWGDFVVNKHVTAGSARAYGRWLGERYRDTPNLVWILGGDQPPTGVEDAWTAMAEGIAEGDGDRHLMTYHPRGWQTSSTFWHDADWLDFNMLQSGHNWDRANHEMILADYGLAPPKPTLDGEPRYEHITDGLSKDPETRRFDAHQVRKAAYNAVLSGALGHTYGCREIYSFWRPDQEAGWGADTPWQQAMDFPGAGHMGYVRALMLSHPWQTLRPMPTLIAAGQGSGGSDAPAALTADGTLALVYVPDGRAVGVNLGKVTGGGVDVSWYNPQTGTSTAVGEHPNKGVVSFAPPAANPDPDFVLVLESSGPDETPPTVERADAARRAGRIIAAFSEPVTGESAEKKTNYRINQGIRIESATLLADDRTVTLATSAMAEGATYALRIRGVRDWAGNAIAADTRVEVTIPEGAATAEQGLIAAYNFDEAEGSVVHDSSGTEPRLDLRIEDGAPIEWAGGGLKVNAPTTILSDEPAEGLIEACMATHSLTVEAWITPFAVDQQGPARIVSLSRDTGSRNFTLAQSGGSYAARLRTTGTSSNGIPELVTPPRAAVTELTHVVYVRDGASGETHLYVNGVESTVGMAAGDFSGWDAGFRLSLANEVTGDRPWLGTLHAARIYSRPLSAADVLDAFVMGHSHWRAAAPIEGRERRFITRVATPPPEER